MASGAAESITLLVLSANRRFLLAVTVVFCPEQLVDVPEAATAAMVVLNLGDSCWSGETACSCFREVDEVGGWWLLY